MNLGTLLEAAEYIELNAITQLNTRGTVLPVKDDAISAFKRNEECRGYAKGYSTSLPAWKLRVAGDHAYTEDDPASRERRRAGGAGTREVHNKLEKNRRAHLKECFEVLRRQLPGVDDKKVSNLTILRHAIQHIQFLKNKDSQLESEMEILKRKKLESQKRINELKADLAQMNIEVNPNDWIRHSDQDSHSTSTATEIGEDKHLFSDDNEDDSSNSDTESDIEVDLPSPSCKDDPAHSANPTSHSKETFPTEPDTRPALTVTITPPSPPPQTKAQQELVPGVSANQTRQKTETQRALQQHILKQQQRSQLPATVSPVSSANGMQRSFTVTTRPVAGSKFIQQTMKFDNLGPVIKKITHLQPTPNTREAPVTSASQITLVNKVLHKAITSPVQVIHRSPLPGQQPRANFSSSQLIGNPPVSRAVQPTTFTSAGGAAVTTSVATVSLNQIQGLRVVTSGGQGITPRLVSATSHLPTLQMMAGVSLQPRVVAPSASQAAYTQYPTLSFHPLSASSTSVTSASTLGSQPRTGVPTSTPQAVAALLSAAGALQTPVTTNQLHSVVTPVSWNPITVSGVNTMRQQHFINPQIISGNFHRVLSPGTTLIGQPKQPIILQSAQHSMTLRPASSNQVLGTAIMKAPGDSCQPIRAKVESNASSAEPTK